MKMIKVINRSDGNVTYSLPELNTRRVFTPNESKDISERELNALFQLDGGAILLKDYLQITDKEWVATKWEAPIEYFWGQEEISNCLLKDSVELFKETLDYAPLGVIDLIKYYSWKLPLTDLNKIDAIKAKFGFDVLAAIEIMKKPMGTQEKPKAQGRLRREEN